MARGGTGYAWVAGRILPLGKAQVPLLDRGYLFGDGVYETMRTAGGRVFEARAHRLRLRRRAAQLGVASAWAERAFDAAERLVRHAHRNLRVELHVRVQLTTGLGPKFFAPGDTPAFTVMARPLVPYATELYRRGARLVVASQRKFRDDPTRGMKPMSFLPHALARRRAVAAGADDALLLNDAGRVCEATTSNVVAVRGHTAFAPGPSEGAVDGVTRRLLLPRLRGLRFRIRPRLTLGDLRRADEVFLTNTIGGVVPVRSIQAVARRLPASLGPVTRLLQRAYSASLHEAA